jgi:hypothetical protein
VGHDKECIQKFGVETSWENVLGRTRWRCEYNIKIDLEEREIGRWEVMELDQISGSCPMTCFLILAEFKF